MYYNINISLYKSIRIRIHLIYTSSLYHYCINTLLSYHILLSYICIQVINFSGTFQVDDDLILNIINKCPHIHSLNIQNCRKITDKTLNYLTSTQSSSIQMCVTSLNLGGNTNITEKGLYQFITSSTTNNNNNNIISNLIELHISGLYINNTILTHITKQCHNLIKIGINYASITEDVLRQFLTIHGSNLIVLHIAWLSTPIYTTTTTTSDSTTTTGGTGGSGGSGVSGTVSEKQLTPEFFSDFLPSACPKLVELDVCGIKCVTGPVIKQYLDSRTWRQVCLYVCMWCIYTCVYYINITVHTYIYILLLVGICVYL